MLIPVKRQSQAAQSCLQKAVRRQHVELEGPVAQALYRLYLFLPSCSCAITPSLGDAKPAPNHGLGNGHTNALIQCSGGGGGGVGGSLQALQYDPAFELCNMDIPDGQHDGLVGSVDSHIVTGSQNAAMPFAHDQAAWGHAGQCGHCLIVCLP